MGNRSPATRRNRLKHESRSSVHSSDGIPDENDYGNANKSERKHNETERIRKEEKADSCHPASATNGPLQVHLGGNNHPDYDQESCMDMNHMADKSTVQNSGDAKDPEIGTGTKQTVCSPTTPTEFTVVLDCVPEKLQKVGTLKFVDNCPKTVLDLKQGIEDEFGIPSCCQNISVENIQLADQRLLKFYRVREGDTLCVQYNSVADVDEILDIVDSLCSMKTYIESIQPILSSGKPSDMFTKSIQNNIFADKVESLAFEYFYPCSSERANANRLLFVQHEGLEHMHRVHELLLLQPWQNIPIEMQYLEHAILRVLWNITASFLIRTLVLQRPTLKAITKSFLRVKVPKEGIVSAPENLFSSPPTMERNRIASEVVYKAAGSMCK